MQGVRNTILNYTKQTLNLTASEIIVLESSAAKEKGEGAGLGVVWLED